MIENSIHILKRAYRYIFLVQNRDYWNACPFEYDTGKDLVLSFDFAVVHMVKLAGGEAKYIDHIVSSAIMEKYNYRTYEFFATWHYNAAKEDIFSYRGVEVASAFRIEIWNDITYYVRIFVNLYELFKKVKYESLYTGIDDQVVVNILEYLKIGAINWSKLEDKGKYAAEYYFPIFKWMEEALHPSNIKRKLKVHVIRVFGRMLDFVDQLRNRAKTIIYIYVERYHPTNNIINELKAASNIKMVRSDFSSVSDMFSGVHLPIFIYKSNKHNDIIKKVLDKFDKEKYARLFVDNIDISNELYRLIVKRVSPLIAKSFSILDVIIDFFSKRQLALMITIASIGLINRLMINYCKKNDIPVYMIINGLLANSFLDEAKEGTWINSYGDSVRKNYFKGMDNIVCLGDPRMDKYSKQVNERQVNFGKPTIGIGASGFTNVDLNCYLAIEFEFLNDIMKACEVLRQNGREMEIIIKIRANGYIQQYKNFLEEYYPDIPVKLYDTIPMEQVYEKIDYLISIYSQTLFEASCRGIPALYYKNDTQYFHPPFDGESELVTAFTQEDLIEKIEAFYKRDKLYDAFKRKEIMEKYIGPLDGQNLKRNMDFIYHMISNNDSGQQCP